MFHYTKNVLYDIKLYNYKNAIIYIYIYLLYLLIKNNAYSVTQKCMSFELIREFTRTDTITFSARKGTFAS